MKGWIIAALILLGLYGLPFSKYKTEKLLPVLCIQARREGEEIRVLSEWGEGSGSTWEEAVEDLREKASGEVFLDTAEQAVFSDTDLAREAAESGDLRPGAEVFYGKAFASPEKLYEYFSQHGSAIKIADLQQENREAL